MWIRVRTMDGKRSEKITSLSKLTKVEVLREKIQEIFGYEAEKQRLFFNGKQLENGYSLFDYDVTLNCLVQVMERILPTLPADDTEDVEEPEPMEERELSDSDSGIDEEKKKASGVRLLPSLGIYKINELVDAQDKDMGAWFEATVVKVEKKDEKSESKLEEENTKLIPDTNDDFCIPVTVQKQTLMESFVAKSTDEKQSQDDNKENVAPSCSSNSTAPSTSKKDENSKTIDENSLIYHVKFEEYDEIHQLPSHMIRPRARRLLQWSDFKEYDMVMANYNPDRPKERGFWYDCVVLEKNMKRRYKELTVEVLLGPGRTLQPCKIVFVEEIFGIEAPGSNNKAGDEQNVPRKRNTLTDPECSCCNDNPQKKCKDCGCHVCGEKKDFDKTLLCDECNLPFHTFCLDPPLDGLPDEDEWYCPLCRNDHTEVVKAGEKLKASKKKSKMKSTNSTTQRDWGKGMACVGRSKVCSIVPPNHFGPVPGIPVGSLWKFRMQVSEAGIHRPHVSGIHGKSEEGAYSIVLAGGYEDDEDNGEVFTYTGSGGRDLSGNKRTAEQSCDQVLTKSNLAIARTCDAKVDTKKGNVAGDWRQGKPIRVVRSYKGAKHSKYAPEDGNRYDGIYKVVKYWPEKGKSGFIVWRYELRRDDPEPAPWTKEGKKRIKEFGLTMQYPDGYLETQATKLAEEEEKKGKKRKRDSDVPNASQSPNKKIKAASYKIEPEVKKKIKLDELNGKYWEEVVKCSKEGQAIFFKKLEETFMCICCQDVVYQPITTECLHNICKSCLKRSFNADVFSCPTCRFDLGKSYKFVVNDNLQKALLKLLPGYENGR